MEESPARSNAYFPEWKPALKVIDANVVQSESRLLSPFSTLVFRRRWRKFRQQKI